jgi:putative redox protein
VHVALTWDGELRFNGESSGIGLVIDGHTKAGPSPIQALAFALAGCLAVDVADIVQKGRYTITRLTAALVAERAPDPPSRFTAVTLTFRIAGDAPPHAVERAIALSHEKYCSVWHSLRQDIRFTTAFEVEP